MSATQFKRIFSGIQPTGFAHLGNYLGAIRSWVKLQEQSDNVIYSIVDLHALTVPQEPQQLRDNIRDMAICLLACGVDPDKSILFQQSKVLQHTGLYWFLSCRTSAGKLNSQTQWKLKARSVHKDMPPLGLYCYPVLMAADILLYKATHVPVGDDQIQHLHLARDLAKSFNNEYGETFPIPQPILGEIPRLKSLRFPDQKMSKSEGEDSGRINLTDDPDAIKRKIRKAVTDSINEITYDPVRRPGVSNLVSIFAALRDVSVDEVCKEYRDKPSVQLKDDLIDLVIDELAPIQQKMKQLRSDITQVDKILSAGTTRAAKLARTNYNEIEAVLGLL